MHRHVREQRVALEHRVDGPLVRLGVRDVLAADQDATRASAPRARRRAAASSSCRSPTGRAGRRTTRPGSSRSRSSIAVKPGNRFVMPTSSRSAPRLGEARRADHAQAPSRTPGTRAWYVCSSAPVRVRKTWAFESVSSFGKISWFSASSGSIVGGGLLGADDRGDVVHPGGDLGGDLGLVVVVHERLGVRLARRADRDRGSCRSRACRRPRGSMNSHLSPASALSTVMSPDQQIAARVSLVLQVLEVRVALDVADLAARRPARGAPRAPASNSASPQSPEMSTPCSSMMRPIVSRISLSTPTRPLSSEFQRSSTEREAAGHLLLVPADAGEAALPRKRLLAALVEVEVQRGRG